MKTGQYELSMQIPDNVDMLKDEYWEEWDVDFANILDEKFKIADKLWIHIWYSINHEQPIIDFFWNGDEEEYITYAKNNIQMIYNECNKKIDEINDKLKKLDITNIPVGCSIIYLDNEFYIPYNKQLVETAIVQLDSIMCSSEDFLSYIIDW